MSQPLTSSDAVLDAMIHLVQESRLAGLVPKTVNINRSAFEALGPKGEAIFQACCPGVSINICFSKPKG